jgi:hypothetical protein
MHSQGQGPPLIIVDATTPLAMAIGTSFCRMVEGGVGAKLGQSGRAKGAAQIL